MSQPLDQIKIIAKPHDLGGGFVVARVLPQVAKRRVGPFVFFDHMGPVTVRPQQNIDVRPHPHIGLSTLTYLIEGRMVHRDSLGSEQTILPSEVNWMTAGKGISHSERSHEQDKQIERSLEGLQLWIALPDELEDCEPRFHHYAKDTIPRVKNENHEISVVAGQAFGLSSPVQVSSPLVFAIIDGHKSTSEISVHFDNFEIGLYVLKGQVKVNSVTSLAPHEMLVLPLGAKVDLQFGAASSFVILGGEPMSSPRHIWWNLVSSSKEKIEAAKQSWINRSFPMVPGETEFIPVPE